MLRQRPAAHIVNIASAASMLGNPRMSVYVASKWALAGWSDSLRIELAQLTPVIRVTRINPFYIATGMFHGVRSPIIPILTPEVVIPRMLRAIEGNALSLQLPWIVNILPFVRSILPSALFDLIVGEWLGVYHTMDAFTGRQNSPQRPE
jgi:short-subunit dehydrogenase